MKYTNVIYSAREVSCNHDKQFPVVITIGLSDACCFMYLTFLSNMYFSELHTGQDQTLPSALSQGLLSATHAGH
jgi:hypothetical protein